MADRLDRRFDTRRIGMWLNVVALPTLLLLVNALPATAQDGAGPPLAGDPRADSTADPAISRRAADLARLFRADPGGYEDVFAPDFLAQVPASALDGIFKRYHAEHGAAETTEVVGPFAGGTTIVRFRFADGSSTLASLSLEPTAPHRITGALVGPAFESTSGSYEVRQVRYPRDDYEPSTSLRLPFDGTWWVFWGGRGIEQNYHRASPQQRYAYDFVIRRGGSTHAGDGKRNEDYWCEGEPVLAPAAGSIVRAVDGVPENTPGEMNADQKLGNHVVIDHGDGEYSLLAHLRTGSVGVEVGDRVTAGQGVGACGNSGNSSEPHLHYQLQTGPDFFASESLPAPFHEYVADGKPVEVGEPVRGQEIAPAARSDR